MSDFESGLASRSEDAESVAFQTARDGSHQPSIWDLVKFANHVSLCVAFELETTRSKVGDVIDGGDEAERNAPMSGALIDNELVEVIRRRRHCSCSATTMLLEVIFLKGGDAFKFVVAASSLRSLSCFGWVCFGLCVTTIPWFFSVCTQSSSVCVRFSNTLS